MSNGVLIGLMYSLIALGFVLVYKATDAVNFAQGEFVMIAGLAVALAMSAAGAPPWGAITAGVAGKIPVRVFLRRGGPRPPLGRPGVAGGRGAHRPPPIP